MFKLLWDNDHACGVLVGEYKTEQAAIDAGEDWLAEMRSADPEAGDDAYSYEVTEEEAAGEPSDDDLACAEEAAWHEELSRGYAIDR